jgi:type VI secretion system secreted protein Hcp
MYRPTEGRGWDRGGAGAAAGGTGGTALAIYLKYEGIDGIAQEDMHKKWFQCESLQWGVSRNVTLRAGGSAQGREATQPSVSEVVVTKLMDTSSPKLFSEACAKPSGKKVEIHLTKSTGETFCEFVLKNTVVSGYSYAQDGNGLPVEQISLNFTEIQYKAIPFDSANKAQSPISASYDLAKGEKG